MSTQIDNVKTQKLKILQSSELNRPSSHDFKFIKHTLSLNALKSNQVA